MRLDGQGFGTDDRAHALPHIASPGLVPDLAAGTVRRRQAAVAGQRLAATNRASAGEVEFHRSAASLPLIGPGVMSRALPCPTILIFDSGLGGLTVYREVARARPDANCIYAADDAYFPYGALAEADLVARVTEVMEALVATHHPDLVVIACNTASTLVLPHLRRHFDLPFVGTVPAIKPACAGSASRRVSVLGTPGTVRREYTRALIREYAGGCEVTLVGSALLAPLAEADLAGEPVSDAAIRAEIAPCFVASGNARTDTVVLACTHYPLLIERLRALAPWPVTWIDPAPAIARRVVALVGDATAGRPPQAPRFFFTSGRTMSAPLAATLARFGLACGTAFDTPPPPP